MRAERFLSSRRVRVESRVESSRRATWGRVGTVPIRWRGKSQAVPGQGRLGISQNRSMMDWKVELGNSQVRRAARAQRAIKSRRRVPLGISQVRPVAVLENEKLEKSRWFLEQQLLENEYSVSRRVSRGASRRR